MTSLEYFYHGTNGSSFNDNVDRPAHDGTTIDSRTTMRINGVTEENGGEYECLVRDLTDDGTAQTLSRRAFTIVVTCKSIVN